MNSEVFKLYDLMLDLYKARQLPLHWREIEAHYTKRWETPMPKRINLLLANGARADNRDGPEYLRVGKGLYTLLSQQVWTFRAGKALNSLSLTQALKEAQHQDTLLLYPHLSPYTEGLKLSKGLTLQGKADKSYQVIQAPGCFQIETDQAVTLSKLCFQAPLNTNGNPLKKKDSLIISQGQVEIKDCAFDFENAFEVMIEGSTSVKFINCSFQGKQLKISVGQNATAQFENTTFQALNKNGTGVQLQLKGQVSFQQSQVIRV